jgi:hypothetical protein
VAFVDFAPLEFDGASGELSPKLLVRIGTNPGGNKCAGLGGSQQSVRGLRVYFDSESCPAGFDVTVR